MSTTIESASVIYPESDGKPMADKTVQFDWIQRLAGNLQILFFDRRAEVFVGGNLFWYPVEGAPRACRLPTVLWSSVGRSTIAGRISSGWKTTCP